jgi:hypothetical protein
MPRTSAYARLLFSTFPAAFGQVNGSALVSALTGKTVVPTVEVGYTGSVANPLMVNGQPAIFPVKTLVYPDGRENFRIEYGILHADANQYKSFKSGMRFQVTKVIIKDDCLELEIPMFTEGAILDKSFRGDVKFMFGKGWQSSMTTESVLQTVMRYLPDTETIAKAEAEAERVRAEEAEKARIAAETIAKAEAERVRAEEAEKARIAAEQPPSEANQAKSNVGGTGTNAGPLEAGYAAGTEGRLGPQNASSDIGGTGTDRYANLRETSYCALNGICAGPSYDVYTMEMSGVRLWMTPDEAKAGLTAKLGDHAQIQVKYAASRLNSSHYVGEMTVSDGDFYIKVSFIEIAPGDAPHPVEADVVYLSFQDNVNVTRADLDELEKSATAEYGNPTFGGGRTATWCHAGGWDECDDGPELSFSEDQDPPAGGLSLSDNGNPLRDSVSEYLQRINNLKNKPPL